MSIRYRVTIWFAVKKYMLRQRIRKWLGIVEPHVSVYARLIGGPYDMKMSEVNLLDLPETIQCPMRDLQHKCFFTHDDTPIEGMWPKFGMATYCRTPKVINQIPILYQFEECTDV